jgi:hypothetical protein
LDLSAGFEQQGNWVRVKNVATGSYRVCFGGFRRRTPGPPPFSSLTPTALNGYTANSQAYDFSKRNWVRFAKFRQHRVYFERLPRFASLTPAPPPFSEMNSTPARSKAARTSSKVRA